MSNHPKSIPEAEIRRFLTFAGSMEFGVITEHMAENLGHPAGPIRLQQGIPGPKGFGYRHIETAEGRLNQLRRLGFHTCQSFVYAVAQRFQKIGEGGGPNKLALVYRDQGHDLQIIVQHNPGGFWSVTTGLPYRVARCRILLEVLR